MHDHIHSIISGLPKENMHFVARTYEEFNIWDFFPGDKLVNHISIKAPDLNTRPEWDEFDKQWYWVTNPK